MNDAIGSIVGGEHGAELARRDAMLGAIGFAAAQIVTTGDWQGGIQNILDRLGQAADVSRAVLFELHDGPDGKLAESCRFDWAAPGYAKLSTDARYLDLSLVHEDGTLDAWTIARQKGDIVQARLSELSGDYRRVFEEQGVLSFISVPIVLQTGTWGFLGFDECRTERIWTPVEIDVLIAAAALIAGAMERARAEEALHVSELRARTVLNTAFNAIITIDVQGRVLEFNAAAEGMFGITRESALGNLISDLIIPAFYRPMHEAGLRRYAEKRSASIIGRMVEVEAQRSDGTVFPVELTIAAIELPEGLQYTAMLRDLTERRRFEARLAESERQKGQLARHFSPNMIEEVTRSGGRFDLVRTQKMAVLFADLIGFTGISAALSGPEVIALLRAFHELVERAVFEHGGTLDKYIGDGVMATFGTPETGPRDASNAISCARLIVDGLNQWNRERVRLGQPRIPIGVGVHYGPATLGDVGTQRRFELTVVGDTVNVASRIEDLTRDVGIAIVASDDVIAAARAEGGLAVTREFTDLGLHQLRGRRSELRLWGLTAQAIEAAMSGVKENVGA